jgi:hypothetical protein
MRIPEDPEGAANGHDDAVEAGASPGRIMSDTCDIFDVEARLRQAVWMLGDESKPSNAGAWLRDRPLWLGTDTPLRVAHD